MIPSKLVPSTEVQMRIFGFDPSECTDAIYNRVYLDPVIRERAQNALAARGNDPHAYNVYYRYKTTPAKESEAHLGFPENFDIEDEASILAIFNRMTRSERADLLVRVRRKD